jgi:UDP-N-acetylmuramate--alanine ligase
MQIKVPGRHNVLNALAAVAVGLDLQIPFEKIAASLSEFRGADRRFQRKGERDGVMVVDDYGHHPTEIQATLAAAATSGRRIVVLFQPHRYTRTHNHFIEFATSFYAADLALVTDIYAASEDPIPGVSGAALAEEIQSHGHKQAEYVGPLANAVDRLMEVVRPGDLVVTLGAGSVYQAGEELLKRLEARAQ